ncbi:MAG: cupin domain-containing protein [Gammaproteobacteria bacterium]|nr:cupin domain-containing protein [Gammaproteobacteria bacterium]
MKNAYKDCRPYRTKDNSEIRELLHPANNSSLKNQSLAEARVATGEKTRCHFHKQSEEIYFILKGKGRMFIDNTSFDVTAGDSILIAPSALHCIENSGSCTLVFLCCCAPAYQHDDTYFINDKKQPGSAL